MTSSYLVHVQPGQTNTLLGITWTRGAPTLSLVSPHGTIYTPSRSRDAVYYTLNGKATHGTQAAVYYLPHPQGGTWRVRVGNLVGNERYQVKMYGNKPLPLLTVSSPRRGHTIVATLKHSQVSLDGTLTGAGAGTTVSLYATTSRSLVIAHHRVPNAMGALVADRVRVVGNRWHYVWNTTLSRGGHYVIFAQVNNGTGPLVTAYAPGSVTVVAPARPDAPRVVRGIDNGHQISLQWRAPVRSATVAGYVVHVHDTTQRLIADTTIDVGLLTAYVVRKPAPQDRDTVTVLAYDQAGHLSRPTVASIHQVKMRRPPQRPHARRQQAFRFNQGTLQILSTAPQ